MSSKSTILLSNANEHWYHDCFDDTFNLEIDPEHDCECDEEGMFITIKKETALYAAIEDLWRFGRNTKPKSPWIPVSERLPEPYKKVLIWSTISIEPDYGCLMGDEWATFETHGMLFGKDRKGKITHWMPLPPPPE